MNIADDHGVPYGVVLLYAQAQTIPAHRWTPHHEQAITAAHDRTVDAFFALQRDIRAALFRHGAGAR